MSTPDPEADETPELDVQVGSELADAEPRRPIAPPQRPPTTNTNRPVAPPPPPPQPPRVNTNRPVSLPEPDLIDELLEPLIVNTNRPMLPPELLEPPRVNTNRPPEPEHDDPDWGLLPAPEESDDD